MRDAVRGRVLLLSTNLSMRGGAEAQTIQLAVRLKLHQWDVQVVSMLQPSGDLSPLREAAVPVHTLHMYPGIADPRAVFRLGRLLRAANPDILHSHMTHANLLARVTRLLYSVPVLICTLHGIRMYGVKSDHVWLRETAHRLTDSFAEATTTVCKAAGERYVRVRAVPPHKIRVIPNGVDTAQFHPDAEARKIARGSLNVGRAFVWLAVGRLERAKDYQTMLRAFSLVAAHPTGLLLISGNGSYERKLRALAGELGISPRVWFLGQRSDVAHLMNAADAYVMSSEFEGLPLVLLEAAATGLPIVATDVGGNAEIVSEGTTGFLSPPGDPQSLAAAMQRLMDMTPEERRRMGVASRMLCVSHYRFERIIDQWEDLYHELLQSRASA